MAATESAPAAPTLLERARPVPIGAAMFVGSQLLAIAAGALAWRALGGAVAELAGEAQAAVDELRAVGLAA